MTQAVFALSPDGLVALRETDQGWLLTDHRGGRDSSTFHYQPFHAASMLLEIRRLLRHPFDRTDYCQTLVGALAAAGARDSDQPAPESLDEIVWGALADLMWVLTS